jgi:3-keto-5-aminohexanoate cleavage enzyme
MLTSKFHIVLAPTGMVPTRQLTPHVPLTPMEIAEDVARCAEIGITSVHLHARDDNGHPDWHREIYAAIIYEVKSRTPDVLINVSTSGRNWSEIEKRADCLSLEGDLKPDLASLTLSSLNFLSGPSINSPEDIYKLASIMLERGITPELELFDLGMVNMVRVLKKKNLLPSTLVVNLFVGNIAGAQATLGELGVLVDRLPEGTIWSGAGIGEYRDRAHALSLAAGGGVRVGLEDGIYLNSRRNVLATNPSLVERVHNMASLLDLEMLKSSELRKLIRSG